MDEFVRATSGDEYKVGKICSDLSLSIAVTRALNREDEPDGDVVEFDTRLLIRCWSGRMDCPERFTTMRFEGHCSTSSASDEIGGRLIAMTNDRKVATM